MRVGYCDRNETMAGCLVINRVDEIPYNVYDGKIICIKRDAELNFYNIERPSITKDALTKETTAKC